MKASKSGRAGGVRWSLKATTKLDLPVVLISCSFFFVAGFFFASSDSFSRHQGLVVKNYNEMKVSNSRQLLAHGKSGDDFFTSIPFQVLSWNPRALYFPNFATADQCKTIINIAKPSLKPSTLALRKGETPNTTKDIRTSYGVFISSADDETGVLDAIEAKIARATMHPRANGEDFNVLRYEIGQRYDAHYDAFNPAEYGPQQSQRVASFLLYLSDVEEGGETMFPFENGLDYDEIYDFRKCLGLKVKPRQGDGLLFYSLFPNTTIDPTSIHGSCPVIKGEKWVATKWIRDQALNENSLLL